MSRAEIKYVVVDGKQCKPIILYDRPEGVTTGENTRCLSNLVLEHLGKTPNQFLMFLFLPFHGVEGKQTARPIAYEVRDVASLVTRRRSFSYVFSSCAVLQVHDKVKDRWTQVIAQNFALDSGALDEPEFKRVAADDKNPKDTRDYLYARAKFAKIMVPSGSVLSTTTRTCRESGEPIVVVQLRLVLDSVWKLLTVE